MKGNCSLAFYRIRLSCDFVLSFICIFFQSYKFDAEVSSGSKRFRCSFTLVLKDEEIDDINIKCNTKPRKKMKISDFVLVSKTMKKFTISFTIHRSMTKILSSAVETGWQVLRYFLYLLLVPLVPCQLGFTRVCNSDQTTLSSTAICPAGIRQVRQGHMLTLSYIHYISRSHVDSQLHSLHFKVTG